MDTTASPNEPPADRYCDLVMKGGITSGVVYPVAISLLSRHYRFKSIGGTSAGAIAAAVTAAAEHQRRHSGSSAGFERLARLPDELGQDVATAKARKLLSLFQPQDGTHRLFAVLVSALNSGSTSGRIASIAWGMLKAYWPAALAGALLGLWVGRSAGGLASLLLATVFVALAVGVWLYRDVSGATVGNGFGLCNGMPGKSSNTEALTPWLHDLIQQAAGRPGGPPLTFGDLWRPPGQTEVPQEPGDDALVLKMFSTNLAHGRPYILPLNEQGGATASRLDALRANERLFFKPDELRPYLPADVHQWMIEHARPYVIEPGREQRDPDPAQAKRLGLVELPPPHHFPVLLAARMSLSFPLLFSAVPLWAIDHDAQPGRRSFRRCWFSDGGISSNFPMHLFDGLVPRWPTFGITLEPKIEGRDNMVYLPQSYREGYGERWNLFDGKPDGIGRFGGFIGAIVGAMQNWNDNTLSRMPGVRDRVARVRLMPNEGGMNLNMEPDNITKVAKRGCEAAEALLARFSTPSSPGAQSAGWDEHRLVRLNVLLKMVEARAASVVHALSAQCPHATPMDTLVDAAQDKPVAGYGDPLSAAQAQTLHDLVNALRTQMEALGATASNPQANPFVPLPKPELRVRPPL
jgi:predicted acylesterase/phospholipase RssA